jgi:hypothetical protein
MFLVIPTLVMPIPCIFVVNVVIGDHFATASTEVIGIFSQYNQRISDALKALSATLDGLLAQLSRQIT